MLFCAVYSCLGVDMMGAIPAVFTIFSGANQVHNASIEEGPLATDRVNQGSCSSACASLHSSASCNFVKNEIPVPSLSKKTSIEHDSQFIEEIEQIVNNVLKLFNVPGIAVGVLVNDQPILSRGYGTRRLGESLPVTEHTLFPVASCTKAFTAFMLGQLVDEGKVSFDDPVIKYIPEFSLSDDSLTAHVTIRDLLAHRTGIARHDPIWFSFEFSGPELITLLQHLEPDCEMRHHFQYNNFMYAIAGTVVERVTGQSWEEALSTRVLSPLEMNDSHASLKQLKMSPDFSFPHAEIEGKIIEIPFRSCHALSAAGGINSTVSDMLKWVNLHLSREASQRGNLVQLRTLEQMRSIQMPLDAGLIPKDDVYQSGYGLGWFIAKYRGNDLIGHGGSIDGFISEVSFLPEEGIGIVILTNSSSDGGYAVPAIRNQIIDKLLSLESVDWVKKMQETREKAKRGVQESIEKFNALHETSASAELKKYTGSYEHPAYGTIEVHVKNDTLICSYGPMITPLYCKSGNIYVGQWSVLHAFGIDPVNEWAFFTSASGEIEKIEVSFEQFRSAKPITFMKKG